MASEVKEEQNSKPVANDDKSEDEEVSQEGDTLSKEDMKENLKNESNEDSGKDSGDDEEEVGLLDRPVEVTGCRARKKVERLEISFSAPKEKQEFFEGKGKKLGECPRIEMQIQKSKVPDLKPLHKILFNRTGSANEIKKNIRKFSGFSFEKDSSEFIRKKTSIEKMTIPVLKQACLMLDLERGGTKDDIVNRIMSFLLKPEDSGKKVPTKKKPKDKKSKTEKKVKSEKKKKSEKGSEHEQDENVDEDSSEREDSVSVTDDENETNINETKTKSKGRRKAKAKVEKGDEKTKASKRKMAEDSSEESTDEQPAVKKSNKMPSDEEISQLVKEILESADLEEITMIKVIRQVSDTYPDFDLTHKKPFIKSTIKSIIKKM